LEQNCETRFFVPRLGLRKDKYMQQLGTKGSDVYRGPFSL